MMAFRTQNISITNTITCNPGTDDLTGKSTFVAALNAAYGVEDAAKIMPMGFLIPSEYSEFLLHLKRTGYRGVWALKESVHRGRGVVAVDGKRAAKRALERTREKKNGDWLLPPQHRFVMAQRFIDDNHVVLPGRAYVLRLWAILAGGGGNEGVFRAYLFDGGLLFFGDPMDDRNADETQRKPRAGERAQAKVVNIFQQDRGEALEPWTIRDLQRHMKETSGTEETFSTFWDTIERSTAAALAAAAPSIRRETKVLRYYQGGNLEILGIDFVVDSDTRPWLVEVNYLPSMARKVINCRPDSDAEGLSSMGTTENSAAACEPNAMDSEKEALLSSFLHVVSARRKSIEVHLEKASEALAKRKAVHQCPGISPELVRQVMDAEKERIVAANNRLVDITDKFYRSLQCMKEKKQGIENGECSRALPPPSVGMETSGSIFDRTNAAVSAGWAWVYTELSWLFPFRVDFHRGCVSICFRFLSSWSKPTPIKIPKYVQTLGDRMMMGWLSERDALPSVSPEGKSTSNIPDVEEIVNVLCNVSDASELTPNILEKIVKTEL